MRRERVSGCVIMVNLNKMAQGKGYRLYPSFTYYLGLTFIYFYVDKLPTYLNKRHTLLRCLQACSMEGQLSPDRRVIQPSNSAG